jgi:hypothetical protein
MYAPGRAAPEMHREKRREGQFTLQRSDKASRIEMIGIDLCVERYRKFIKEESHESE